MEWIFKPSEAYDAIVFCNAVSTVDHYSRHYPGLREEWSTRLGKEGLQQLDSIHQSTSMSRLCFWLEYMKPNTLDDLLSLFSTANRLQQLMEYASRVEIRDAIGNLIDRKDGLFACFQALKSAGFDVHWKQFILSTLENKADDLLTKASKYNLREVQEVLNEFLAVDYTPLATRVYITYYSKPIAFQLPGGAMVCNADHLPTPEAILRLAIHESIHGFPGTERAQKEQDRLRSENPAFEAHYQSLMTKFHTGPEEYFVVAAEAYITEQLGLRSYDECLAYVDRQNGGMPFAREIYTLLRQCKPERGERWSGYGSWLVEQMRAGHLSARRH